MAHPSHTDMMDEWHLSDEGPAGKQPPFERRRRSVGCARGACCCVVVCVWLCCACTRGTLCTHIIWVRNVKTQPPNTHSTH
jgi:hypothetical protein